MKKFAVVFGLAVMLAAAAHAKPLRTWRSNTPVDGRHMTKTIVTVSAGVSTVLLSTDTTRFYWYAEFTHADTSTDKLYWAQNDTVTADPDSFHWVQEGDYFSSDDPICWQGAIQVLKDGSGSGTVIVYSYQDPEP